MTQTIYKYPLTPGVRTGIDTHEGAQVQFVSADPGGQLCIWIRFDPDQKPERLHFLAYGTGHPMHDEAHESVGSALCGPFVWHVFEVFSGED